MTDQADASIRASGLWEYHDCAYRAYRKAEYDYAVGVPAAIGTAVHASTGAFDQAKLDDDTWLTVDDAAGLAVDMLQRPQEDIDWSQSEISRSDAERRALFCHTRYCNDIAPTRQYLAVEEKLEPMLVRLKSGIVLELTGHLDRRRIFYAHQGESWQGVSDIKTGVRAVNSDGSAKLGRHGPQLGVYQLLAEHQLGINMTLEPEIIGLQTGGQMRVGVASVPNARKALVGTPELPGFLDYVGEYFRSGLFPPNPGSMLCSPKYCPVWPDCPYHD